MKLKKLKQPIIAIILVLFSFYYTNKAIEIVRNADPIMKQIKATTEKYEVSSQNAKILGNKIIPGKNGKTINYIESYNKMKDYGAYNEVLTTLEEVKPAISVDDYYDKYIVSGNTEEKSVALVFKIEENTNPDKIINILKTKTSKATFFIDGIYTQNNSSKIEDLSKYFQIELLSYNNEYNENEFITAKSYLNSLIKKETKYCYAEYDRKEVIEVCSKLLMHTIIPTIKVETSPYKEIKEKLSNSAIIYIPINQTSEEELSIIINYIKTRGYKLLTLEELLSESLEK